MPGIADSLGLGMVVVENKVVLGKSARRYHEGLKQPLPTKEEVSVNDRPKATGMPIVWHGT